MTQPDIVIRNGTIFDGLRTPRFVSDIGIKNGKTQTIGRISKEAKCATEIDATGLNVCPGFIDLHTHYETGPDSLGVLGSNFFLTDEGEVFCFSARPHARAYTCARACACARASAPYSTTQVPL